MKHPMGFMFACVLMLLLVLLLPALGVSMGRSGLAGILIAACIAAHLLLMRDHGKGGGNKKDNNHDH